MARRRLAAAVAGLLALTFATALAACGDDNDAGRSVPDDAVAVVGEQKVSEQALDERVDALLRAQRPATRVKGVDRGDPKVQKQLDEQLRSQALSLLLMTEALEQEAADRGVTATAEEARERWDAVAARQFPTRKALRRFLGGQTERDAIEQLRLQMLSERIHEQVAEQAGGGKRGQRAVRRFQREFRGRWRDETACRDGLRAVGCPSAADE